MVEGSPPRWWWDCWAIASLYRSALNLLNLTLTTSFAIRIVGIIGRGVYTLFLTTPSSLVWVWTQALVLLFIAALLWFGISLAFVHVGVIVIIIFCSYLIFFIYLSLFLEIFNYLLIWIKFMLLLTTLKQLWLVRFFSTWFRGFVRIYIINLHFVVFPLLLPTWSNLFGAVHTELALYWLENDGLRIPTNPVIRNDWHLLLVIRWRLFLLRFDGLPTILLLRSLQLLDITLILLIANLFCKNVLVPPAHLICSSCLLLGLCLAYLLIKV